MSDGSSEQVVEAIESYGNVTESSVLNSIGDKNFKPEAHDTNSVIIGERIVHDLKHAISRSEDDAGEFPILPLLEEISDSHEVYLDHSTLDNIYSKSYDDASMVDASGLSQVEDFLAENTTDLDMDQWSDQLGEEGDDLYEWVSHYQDSVLLTYDGDFGNNEMALTPEEYLGGIRAAEVLNGTV